MRSALLIAFGAPVAGYTRHSVLTRTLATRLVAGFPRGADRMAVTRYRKNA